jgi:hypothetical protein
MRFSTSLLATFAFGSVLVTSAPAEERSIKGHHHTKPKHPKVNATIVSPDAVKVIKADGLPHSIHHHGSQNDFRNRIPGHNTNTYNHDIYTHKHHRHNKTKDAMDSHSNSHNVMLEDSSKSIQDGKGFVNNVDSSMHDKDTHSINDSDNHLTPL